MFRLFCEDASDGNAVKIYVTEERALTYGADSSADCRGLNLLMESSEFDIFPVCIVCEVYFQPG